MFKSIERRIMTTKFDSTYKFILESIENPIKPFEDYSEKIEMVKSKTIPGKCFKYTDCTNNCIISEDSLSRTLSIIEDKDFAILTAYRAKFDKKENIIRNRMLRSKLNDMHMGVHQLVGHWQEGPDGKPYEECDKSELIDVIERSYLVAKPENMTSEEFEQIIASLLTIDGETQDAAIIKNSEGIFLLYNSGTKEKIGNDCSLGKINQAYSQHVKNNLPFVFEGIEMPDSNIAKQMYKVNNICYTAVSKNSKNVITESSINRIMKYVKDFECAAISASRGMIKDVTDNTFIPVDYKDQQLTAEINKKRNSLLKAKLLKLGYGVTALDGKYAEAGTEFPGKETSYFVVNRNEDPEFFNNIFKLSEYFNQDSFLYKPVGTTEAKLIGTNNAERNEDFGTPGYNQEINVGEFHPNGFDGALSKIGNKAFQFRLNENKQQNKKFLTDKILCEEIFENLPIVSKSAVTRTAKKINI